MEASNNIITKLYDICAHFGWLLTWQTHPPAGQAHNPVLLVTAVLSGNGLPGQVQAVCTSNNTKVAKRMAAASLLEHPAVVSAVEASALRNRLAKPQEIQDTAQEAKGPTANHKGTLASAMQRVTSRLKGVPGWETDMFHPEYTLEIDGTGEAPVFLAKVSIKLPGPREVVANGSARQKRQAIHEAAAAAMKDPAIVYIMEAVDGGILGGKKKPSRASKLVLEAKWQSQHPQLALQLVPQQSLQLLPQHSLQLVPQQLQLELPKAPSPAPVAPQPLLPQPQPLVPGLLRQAQVQPQPVPVQLGEVQSIQQLRLQEQLAQQQLVQAQAQIKQVQAQQQLLQQQGQLQGQLQGHKRPREQLDSTPPEQQQQQQPLSISSTGQQPQPAAGDEPPNKKPATAAVITTAEATIEATTTTPAAVPRRPGARVMNSPPGSATRSVGGVIVHMPPDAPNGTGVSAASGGLLNAAGLPLDLASANTPETQLQADKACNGDRAAEAEAPAPAAVMVAEAAAVPVAATPAAGVAVADTSAMKAEVPANAETETMGVAGAAASVPAAASAQVSAIIQAGAAVAATPAASAEGDIKTEMAAMTDLATTLSSEPTVANLPSADATMLRDFIANERGSAGSNESDSGRFDNPVSHGYSTPAAAVPATDASKEDVPSGRATSDFIPFTSSDTPSDVPDGDRACNGDAEGAGAEARNGTGGEPFVWSVPGGAGLLMEV